jgi:large subunit ribosomal protein L28
MTGNNVSHSKRRTKTQFMPNIQKLTLPVNGETKRVKICTRCLRTRHKVARA